MVVVEQEDKSLARGDGISAPHMKAVEQNPAVFRPPQTEPDGQSTVVELKGSTPCACGVEEARESSLLAAEGEATAVSVHLANTDEGTVTLLLDVACESGGGACPEACTPTAPRQQQLQSLPGRVLELGHTAQREADAPVRLGEPAAVASAKPTAHAPIRADSLLQSDSGDAAQLQQEPSAEKAASGNKYSGPAMDSTEAAPNLSAQPLELSQHTVPAPIMPKVETDSGDSETDVSAYSPIVTEKADKQQVVWARVKGYPSWPAQVMSQDAATMRLENVRPGKGQTLPVMFFGTFEIAWLAPSAVESWKAGVSKGYLSKTRKDRRLPSSIEQAVDFILGDVHPLWWWQPTLAASGGTSAGMEQQRSTQSTKKSNMKRSVSNGKLGVRPESKLTKTKRAPSGGALVALLDDASGTAPEAGKRSATAPDPLGPTGGRPQLGTLDMLNVALPAPRRTSASRLINAAVTFLPGGQAPVELDSLGSQPPRYEFTRRNIWPSYLNRPRRMPRDDIPTCDCCPPQPVTSEQADRRIGSAPRAASPEVSAGPVERSARVRAPVLQEHGKSGCGPDCMNRQSYVHCDAKTCPCGEQCTNRPFYFLRIPQMTVFHTGSRGWGVRAEEPIPQGAFVVEYTGELLNKVEKQRRVEEQARAQALDFYMMEHSPGIIIDARIKGNLARLINSSCDPNCETQKWRDAATDEVRIGIFARRDIAPGEELAYDYNFEHSGLAEQAGAYRCKCGAANCRGTMDTQPDRLKDAYRRIEVFWEGDNKFYRGTILGFQAATGQHILQYDDGQRTKEKLSAVEHRWLPDDAILSPDGGTADSVGQLVTINPVAGQAGTQQDTLPLKKRRLGSGPKKAACMSLLPGQHSAPHSMSSATTDFNSSHVVEAKPAVDSKDIQQPPFVNLNDKAAETLLIRPPQSVPQQQAGSSVLMSILQNAAKRKEEMAKSGLLVGPDPMAMASVTNAGHPEPIIKPAIAGCAKQEG